MATFVVPASVECSRSRGIRVCYKLVLRPVTRVLPTGLLEMATVLGLQASLQPTQMPDNQTSVSYNFSQDASLLTYYNQDTNLATVERLLETVWTCPPLDTITAQKLNAVRGQAHEAGMGTQEVRCKRVHFNEAERWVELTTPFRAPAREKAALHGRMSTTLSFPSLFCLAVNLFCN